MSAIDWQKPFHANLYYHVLSKIDLGANAANLYSPSGFWARFFGREPDWAAPLVASFESTPAAMTAQILPLATSDLKELRRWLGEYRRPFDDLPGRELADRLLWALREEEGGFTFDAGTACIERFRSQAEPTLAALLDALWRGRRPELTVLSCDPLTDGEFSHGRCYRTPATQVVAVSFACAPVMTAIQLLHEVTHAVTDPQVLAGRDASEHSTVAGTPGHRLHLELERAVVEHDARLIERVAPEWMEPYARWRARWRI